jgi:hypothetical protein
LSPRSPPQNSGATELKRILDCATNTDNLAFTLVVHVGTFIGRPFIEVLSNAAGNRGKTTAPHDI